MASAPTGSVHHPKAALRLSASSCSLHPSGTLVQLQEMGLVEYERYHGASLTEEGLSEALRLVRRHRLIETFLLEQLGYSWEDVHEEAEKLEHAISNTFTEHLAALLDTLPTIPRGTLSQRSMAP
jgi:DtxR family Mn-dependent transcriptional regulator